MSTWLIVVIIVVAILVALAVLMAATRGRKCNACHRGDHRPRQFAEFRQRFAGPG